MRTADEIINGIVSYLDGGGKISDVPYSKWEDVGLELNIALGVEDKALGELEQKLAKEKVIILDSQEKRNVTEANSRLEATDLHLEVKDQRRKCDRIKEFIKLVKLRARGEQF